MKKKIKRQQKVVVMARIARTMVGDLFLAYRKSGIASKVGNTARSTLLRNDQRESDARIISKPMKNTPGNLK